MDDAFSTIRYLIIDDFEQMRVSFKGMLGSVGAQDIVVKSTGEEGLKSLAGEKFDVVICDYNLGAGKDGQQVLEEARHLGYLGHACTFFMVTAESNMPMVLGALEHQPDEYMVKPINREVLLHRLSGALQRKRQLAGIDEVLSQGDKARAIALCVEHRGGDLKRSLYLAKLQGELCIDLARYDEAQAVYEELLKVRAFPWARFGLGKIAYLRGDPAEAQRIFEVLVEQNQHYLEVYDWLAKVLEEQGDTGAAQSLLIQATQLSPKMVKRQRTLGRIALENDDTTVAERAYQAAVRWGRHSCFASAEEYRQLAAIYHDSGQSSKMLRLLSDGRNRFSEQPGDRVRVLCSQALYKRQLDEKSDVTANMQEMERLLQSHGKALQDEELMTVAGECYLLSFAELAESMLKTVLCNHHDESEWVERVRRLMQQYDRNDEAEELISSVQGELAEVQQRSSALLSRGGVEQAVSLLTDVIELYPGNRTLNLLAVGAMIDYMRIHGVNQSYQFRCRHSLANLLQRDRQDREADRFLGQLTQLSA